MDLGTRAGANVEIGAVSIYLGDSAAITLESTYGADMTLATFATLLANFDNVGTAEKEPGGGFDPVEYDMVNSSGNEGKAQLASLVKTEFDLLESDNNLMNELLPLAEARTPIDILFVKNTGLAVGDRVTFYRSVYFTIQKVDKHSHDAPDMVHIKVEMKVKNVRNVHGQWAMIANP